MGGTNSKKKSPGKILESWVIAQKSEKIPGRIFPKLENPPQVTSATKKKGSKTPFLIWKRAIGRNVIGYDLSPANIEFCRQRFETIMNEEGESRQNVSIEESVEEADFDLVESEIRELVDENLVAA